MHLLHTTRLQWCFRNLLIAAIIVAIWLKKGERYPSLRFFYLTIRRSTKGCFASLSGNGEFEKAFIEKAQGDGAVEAFCKLNEQKHTFLRLRYVKENGLPGYYHPDFLVRTADSIYLTETKAETMLALPDVQRKRRAAIAWCERINELPNEARSKRQWHYTLGGERLFYEFRSKGASLEEVLNFARLRPKAADTGVPI